VLCPVLLISVNIVSDYSALENRFAMVLMADVVKYAF
jgi:hypothetical protein